MSLQRGAREVELLAKTHSIGFSPLERFHLLCRVRRLRNSHLGQTGESVPDLEKSSEVHELWAFCIERNSVARQVWRKTQQQIPSSLKATET